MTQRKSSPVKAPPESNIFNRRPLQYPIRLTRKERRAIQELADEKGISMQEWHRQAFLDALVRQGKLTDDERLEIIGQEKAAGHANGASRSKRD